MNLDPFTGPGSTPARRRFWNDVRSVVQSCQKREGTNVSIIEHPGQGSLINVRDRTRTSSECPSSLSLRFDSVLIDCGCFNAGSLSDIFTDGGNFNGSAFAMVPDTSFPDCAPCAKELPGGSAGDVPSVHEKVYIGDCSGDPISDAEHYLTVAVANVSGTWYVMARFFSVLFFFGSASDLSSPIPNLLTSCNLTPATLVNDFTTCYGLASTAFAILGHGGTATATT